MERADRLLRVAQHVLNAAVAPAEWTSALDAMATFLHADNAIMLAHDTASGHAVIAKSARMDHADFARFLSPQAARWMTPLLQAMPGGTVVTVPPQLMHERDFERCELYNEVVRRVNGFYAVAVRHELPTLSLFVAGCRSRSAGDFAADDAANLQALLPYLANGLQLHHRLQAAQERNAALATVLDRLGRGVILTDAAARPMFLNAEAARIAAEGDGLTIHGEALTAATPLGTHRLRAAVARAEDAIEGQRLCLERPSHRPPLLLTLLPISRLGALLLGIGAPQIAIFITEPDGPVEIDKAAVREAFRLTPRECEVATRLALGLDLDQIAAALRISRGTVRSHLVQVYEKAGVRSQAALVALLSRFTAR